jgi:hypothetical protein
MDKKYRVPATANVKSRKDDLQKISCNTRV